MGRYLRNLLNAFHATQFHSTERQAPYLLCLGTYLSSQAMMNDNLIHAPVLVWPMFNLSHVQTFNIASDMIRI